MKHAEFFRGAAVMTCGALFSKAVGALYRIPLARFLGGYGTGLYQMAYPLFLLFLTFSSAGIPSALSRTVAGEIALGHETRGTLKTALLLFGAVGLAGSLCMCIFAVPMSAFQGDNNLIYCYYALAPSVFLVALVSVLRGYFQGKNDMVPTAVSEFAESVIKAGAGLAVLRLARTPVQAACAALACVTLSELAALLLLVRRCRGERRLPVLRRVHPAGMFSSVLPVMLAAALLPLSRTADSIVIVRLMAKYEQRAVSLYGLFTGGAAALVDLPASLAGGLVAVSVPSVSAAFARGDREGGRRRCALALLVTVALSAPCALALYFFAPAAVKLLFPGLSPQDSVLLVSLVKVSGVSAVLLASVNTLSACLTGMGRAKYAARSMFLAVLVKFLLQWVLVSDPVLSIKGAALSMNVCYLVAFFLDSVYTWRKTVGREKHDHDYRIGNAKRRSHAARAEGNQERGQSISA